MKTSSPTDRMKNAGDHSQQAQSRLDQRFMSAAIRYARRHEGLTAENPSVAALIVRYDDDQAVIVGRGLTQEGGRPHAEVMAISEAEELARGACMYVTLEPCSHFGKSPPCANAIIEAGITRVVVAANDPDDRVSGQGFETLRAAGNDVVTGVLAADAEYGLSGFLKRVTKNRPFVTLKMAMSADGIIGAHSGEQIKITGEISNHQVHLMRAVNDAILVGSGTVINDDPSLTCRLNGLEHRSPFRIILDRRLRISASSNLIQTATKVPTAIATSSDNIILQAFENNGGSVIRFDGSGEAEQLEDLMQQLGDKNISTLLVEGGAQISKAFLDAGLVDRLVIFQSQSELADAKNAVKAPVIPQNISGEFTLRKQLTFGSDIMYEYEPKER